MVKFQRQGIRCSGVFFSPHVQSDGGSEFGVCFCCGVAALFSSVPHEVECKVLGLQVFLQGDGEFESCAGVAVGSGC